KLTADAVVVAESLTPGQFLALDRTFLKGLVLASAGGTSHTVILARSFNIPTLAGALVAGLTPAARRYYDLEERRTAGRRAQLQRLADHNATTADGVRIEIAA